VEEREREPEPMDPDPRPDKSIAPSPEAVANGIARGLVAIHHDSYGSAAQDAHVHIVGNMVVAILDDIELLPNEEFMIEHGQAETVKQLRDSFQKAIEPTFRAAVERATGRRVTGFASHTQLEEPRFAVEIFRLAPEA
jgi:uncharacterized protein YbcI